MTGVGKRFVRMSRGVLLSYCRRMLYDRGVVVQRPTYPLNRAALERTGRYYPVDFEETWVNTIERVREFTQTSPERLAALCAAVEHVVRHRIGGDLVECGVWKGGSMMAVALTLLSLDDGDRELYLYDTFAGMPPASSADVDFGGQSMHVGANSASASETARALASTGYDERRVHLIEGRVEDTIPAHAPARIALLRLDTDWYESTSHELEHLFPRLVPGGILIVDDYGHYRGARQAVDEYFANEPVFLSRIDYTGRLVVKPIES